MIADVRVLADLAAAVRHRQGIAPAFVEVREDESVATDAASTRWARLTQAEQRVCLAIAAGLSNKAIAQQLSSSPRTVETHVSRILRKLDLTSRLQVGLFVSSQPVTDQDNVLSQL